MKIDVLEPKGYCAGVINAIYKVKKARKDYPNKEIYVFGMLVHNQHVVNMLDNINVKTINYGSNYIKEFENNIPNDCVVVFTAHGHDEKLDEIAKQKRCIIIDAVCPKVQENLKVIKEAIKNGEQIIYIGQSNHPETVAALSVDKNVYLLDTKILINYQQITSDNPLVINQTTLNINSLTAIYEDIKAHIPGAKIQNEICKATRLRQEALSNLSNDVDLVFVIGDKASSNTNKLYEISKISNKFAETIMISDVDQINNQIIQNKNHIVISSGSSTPPEIIDAVIDKINSLIK